MTFAIDARGLEKVYKGNVAALAGVDLDVKAGDIFALLGPNGAGKTTLMRILTTQIEQTSGQARVFGHDVLRDGAAVRRLVGYVPQEVSVWSDISGYENLLIYAKIYGIPNGERQKLIWDVLDQMDIRDAAHALVRTYSGGMTRRLEIASAMLIRPPILFLDEPTIGLDPLARSNVWKSMTAFRRQFGTTVFFATHYMDEADRYADRIAIFSRGRVMGLGTAASLKASAGPRATLEDVFSKYAGSSFEQEHATESMGEMRKTRQRLGRG